METNPWSWYTDPEILRLEQERIFRRSWHYAGHTGQVARSGDRFACRAGDVPVLVVRDGADLRAFLNVCRHRGSVLVEGEAAGATIQCRYHAWTYGLDGSLRRAPRAEREPAFDADGLGLCPVQVATWGPFVFANPDLDGPPLDAALGDLPALVTEAGLDLDAVRFRERVHYELAANWKIAAENYLECYHCPVAHKRFSAVVDVSPDAYRLEGRDGLWSQYCVGRSGGEHGQFHLLWPGFKLNVFPGCTNVSVGPLWPEGPERTGGFLDYFFGDEVAEEDVRNLLALDDQVGREDRALVEAVQRGVRSGLLEAGRLMPESEWLVAGFQQRVAAVLGSVTRNA